MYKKVLISLLCILIVFILFIVIWNLKDNPVVENETNSVENLIDNSVAISEEKVTDECTNEWQEYIGEIEQRVEDASSNVGEDNTHYLLKDVNGYIFVYYLNDENEELLYKRTTISTDYLSQEDLATLKDGIEVIGIENLNKMLEDFE